MLVLFDEVVVDVDRLWDVPELDQFQQVVHAFASNFTSSPSGKLWKKSIPVKRSTLSILTANDRSGELDEPFRIINPIACVVPADFTSKAL